MKLAILGHSPLALEAALRFHLHGAALTWYTDDATVSGFASIDVPAMSFTSDLGLSVLREINLSYAPSVFSWKEWLEKYEKPLMDYLRAHQEVKNDELVSVTKRFLAPGEVIPGRTRFLDLFRVIFHVDPHTFIEEQKDSNPETYKRLTEEFVTSLASTIEMYQDYDIVFDFRSDLSRASANAGGRALGETRKSDKVHYALDALSFVTSPALKDQRELAIVGSDSLAAEVLVGLSDWLSDQRSQLFVVTTEEEPFQQFFSEGNPATVKKVQGILLRLEGEFHREIEAFTEKLREWQDLDDFVRAKKPRPAEPIPRLNFFSGHNVTAIDELIDRKRMFLTLEKPEFRSGKKHPENNHLDLKTVGVDQILVTHAQRGPGIVNLDEGEAGYFELLPSRPSLVNGWERDLKKLEGIEDEIFKLFSPVDAH